MWYNKLQKRSYYMFGRRPDGKRIKTLAPIPKIIPHIMSARHDSQNLFKYEVLCDPIDKFIKSVSLRFQFRIIADENFSLFADFLVYLFNLSRYFLFDIVVGKFGDA